MNPTNGTQGGRRHFEVATEASKLTAGLRIRGSAAKVLEQGTRLLGLVATELDAAELLHLRVHYDPASRPSYVVHRGAGDVLEVVGSGAMDPAESELWRLALCPARTGHRSGPG